MQYLIKKMKDNQIHPDLIFKNPESLKYILDTLKIHQPNLTKPDNWIQALINKKYPSVRKLLQQYPNYFNKP
jgi:hypothetical protein